ncbi:MAG: DUF1302 family protein [Pseudomonadota bacterium]
MHKQKWGIFLRQAASLLSLGLATVALAPVVHAQEGSLPALGEGSSPWKVDVFYENATHFRGKDNTGNTVGLSKFRNTLQAEADKNLSDGWAFHGIFRGTYDGVYQLNKDEYGKNAGGAVNLENSGGPVVGIPFLVSPTSVPFGQATVNQANIFALGGPFLGNTFGFNSTTPGTIANPSTGAGAVPLPYNPNQGLRVLFDRWGANPNGVQVAVPVRPCNIDSRGCTDFGGYGDKKQSELEAPEFNNKLDFIREFYVKKNFNLDDGKQVFVKLGKQQVVWGRTDLFRVLDVINPVDYSRNNIYDELQDIRIPMWILQAEYRMGASDTFQDRNVSVVWNFDQFRPNNLGQCGTPNVILDAGCILRAFKSLWDNGGTVGNFANGLPGLTFPTPGLPSGAGNGTFLAADFGPHTVGIRNVELPDWSFKNTQLGIKWEGVTAGGFSFSLNGLTYRSQLPSLHQFNTGVTNPFTGAIVDTSNLIAFDLVYPRVSLLGGSADFQIPDANLAVRLEAALTHGEEFGNSAQASGYSKNRVFRSVIGLDRPTIIPWINEAEATLFSAQLFYQHIFDHELRDGPYGKVGMVDWENNFTGTLLIRASLMNARLIPQVIMARDFKAHAFALAPSLGYRYSDNLSFSVGANFKFRADQERWHFDDSRSQNPFGPFTSYPGNAGPFTPGSAGLGGLVPLGAFRAGPIGAAWREDEIQFSMKYKF